MPTVKNDVIAAGTDASKDNGPFFRNANLPRRRSRKRELIFSAERRREVNAGIECAEAKHHLAISLDGNRTEEIISIELDKGAILVGQHAGEFHARAPWFERRSGKITLWRSYHSMCVIGVLCKMMRRPRHFGLIPAVGLPARGPIFRTLHANSRATALCMRHKPGMIR